MKFNLNTIAVLCIMSLFSSVTASATVTVKPCGEGTSVTLTPPVTVGAKEPVTNAAGGSGHSTQVIGSITYCCKSNKPVEAKNCEPKTAVSGTAKSFAPTDLADDVIIFGR